jgi:hypothetical protein
LLEVWSVARYDLGLPEDEVGRLTLAEYDALIKRKEAEDNRAQLNAGIVAAAVYNTMAGGIDGKAVMPHDFVPALKQAESVWDMRELTPEEQKAYIFRMFGKDPTGRDVVKTVVH